MDSAPVSFRPQRARKVAIGAAIAVVVVFTAVSFGLTGSTGDSTTAVFQRGDQTAMIGLGIAFAAGILLFLRPRVEADAAGIRIRNVIGSYDLPWEVVRAIRFDGGVSFASAELHDDELITIVALQVVDKEYALGAVRSLRALLAAHQAAAAVPAEPAAAEQAPAEQA
ncbi:PH domain-containing protein [Asanoa hainanensis]|uniref:PH domain-containing protein n=1 Tax=Asanoa hainanensis TaxID=560556 RepID=A0A239PHX7_9ACTN|nr:PH domain-containing protein [Asanoa hainanensis]SNT66208.1 PH domain-containing protein [Asanoa hainanensis]